MRIRIRFENDATAHENELIHLGEIRDSVCHNHACASGQETFWSNYMICEGESMEQKHRTLSRLAKKMPSNVVIDRREYIVKQCQGCSCIYGSGQGDPGSLTARQLSARVNLVARHKKSNIR